MRISNLSLLILLSVVIIIVSMFLSAFNAGVAFGVEDVGDVIVLDNQPYSFAVRDISSSGCIVINEVMYDPDTTNESDHEWVEIYNTCDETIGIVGWNISDNKKARPIPSFNISSLGFAVIAASTKFYDDFPEFNGSVVFINGSIGNGLNNDGDRITLNNSMGTVIDEMSYGDNALEKEGHSLERSPLGCGGFIDNSDPTPGAGLASPGSTCEPTPTSTPTLTPTATPSPTPTATPEPSPTLEPTETPSPTQTTTPTPVPTMTPTPTPETTPTPTPAPTASPSPTPQPTATPGGTVASKGDMLINEVQYNPPQSGTDTAYEWFELYNNRSETIEMVGWGIRDNDGYDAIPSMIISAHGFVVVVATDNFSVNFPDYSGAIIFISDGRVGNGLGNEGDCLILIDSGGNTIDELSYGSDTTINSSWMKKVIEGHSMERQPAGGSFIDNSEPTPGLGLPPPAPTPVPTPTPSSSPVVSPTPVIPGTVASRSDILVNEVQYNPPQSNSESAYEWLELYNTLDHVVSLSGWRISDNYGSDAISFVNISPHGFAVVAASRSFYENYPNCLTTIIFIDDGCIGNGLGNNGDCVVLRDSDDNVIDAFSYGDDDSITSTPFKRVGEGHSMERRPAGGEFVENMEPAPGGGLTAPTSTPQASPVTTNTSTGTVANRSAVLINEVQNNPPQSGSDSSWEWIELYNPGAEAVELIGWGIGDNHETDEIPSLNVSAGSLVIVAASENFSDNFPDYDGPIVFIADGRIGNGLGNGGDHLVLQDSAGAIIDETSYGDDESLTVSPLLDVADGHSLERAPCGGQFIDNDAPTPGRCLSVISSCIDPAASAQVPPMSDSNESTTINQQQSTDISRSANARAYTSSSIYQAMESPGLSLSALLVTLSLSLISILGWMLYRRKSR